MDRSVDRVGGSDPADDAGPAEDAEYDDSEDIESELYCSIREAGVGAVSFGPVADL